MTAAELTNLMIPPLRPTDQARTALNWMDEFRVGQLPVVDGKKYLGLVADHHLLDLEDETTPISQIRIEHPQVYAKWNSHFSELLRLSDEHQVELLAILDDEDQYQGVVSIKDTLSVVTKLFATQIEGSILVLSMYQRDYSLSEISRLVESNGAIIVSSFMEIDEYDSSKIKLTLKINKEDITRIIATFERFEYHVIASFQSITDRSLENERLDMLYKYLSI